MRCRPLTPLRLLYYCPFASGGIVDYALAQAGALADSGVNVTLLTTPQTVVQDTRLSPVHCLSDDSRPLRIGSPRLRQIVRAGAITRNIQRLKNAIVEQDIKDVLLATYSEYAAPLWAFGLRRLARSGVRFSAVLHDPVRDYVVGPPWWHRWSVQEGYSFLQNIFAHEEINREESRIPAHVRHTVIPHGPFRFPEASESGETLRCQLGIPAEARLLLSFGQIRDGKNLGLVIQALRHFDNLWLLVAGKQAGGRNRSVKDYQELAEATGVADRCRWVTDYIPPAQVGSYITAADLMLLTYSRAFRSASGVLNAAVQFRKPCIASSGLGALKTQVQRYRLGIWTEPDDPDALQAALNTWLGGIPEPLWCEYLSENSWVRNAQLVRDQLLNG